MKQPSMPMQPQQMSSQSGDEIDLVAIGRLMRSGWRWLLGSVLACGTVGVLVALSIPPTYQSSGMLQIETMQSSMALPAAMKDLLDAGDTSSEADTQSAIISSRSVLGNAVRKLGLEIFVEPKEPFVLQKLHLRVPAFLGGDTLDDDAVIVDALEVPSDWLGEPMTLTVTGRDAFTLTLPDDTEIAGKTGTLLRTANGRLSLLIRSIDAPAGSRFVIGRQSLSDAIGSVDKNFAATSSIKATSILSTTYRASSPDRAAKVLEAITAAYLQQNVESSAASAESSLEFIKQQLPQARKNVSDAEEALNTYRQKQQSVDVTYETQALLQRVTQIEASLAELDLKEIELKQQYTSNHPAFQALLENRAQLQQQLEDAKKATLALPETQKDIFNLQRNLDVAQQVYMELLNRVQDLQVMRASTVGSVRVIDHAEASDIPVAPRKSLIAILSVVLGLMIGCAIVFMRQMLRQGIRSADEIEALGIPVFATVPFASEADHVDRKRGKLPILALTDPGNISIEAMRSLRTALHFGLLDAKTRTIQITSAAPDVGKSFTALNLATVAAQAGQKVCLIDADMRRGYLHRYLGLERTVPGLSDHLGKVRTLEEVLRPGPAPNLSVICSGRYPPNPSELLMREEFSHLLSRLDGMFDLIVLDSPPTLAVTDPVVIGRMTGATIVVARHMETVTGELQAVQSAFDVAGVRVTGAVLNAFRASEVEAYGAQGQYHYNYRYSYKSRS